MSRFKKQNNKAYHHQDEGKRDKEVSNGNISEATTDQQANASSCQRNQHQCQHKGEEIVYFGLKTNQKIRNTRKQANWNQSEWNDVTNHLGDEKRGAAIIAVGGFVPKNKNKNR